MFFKTRSAARAYALKTNRKVSDMGSSAPAGRRWVVRLTSKVVC